MCAGMPRVGASTRMALATLLCLSVHGCQNVSGGAVELSWKLRPASASLEEKFVACAAGSKEEDPARGNVIEMRLDWEVSDPGGVRAGFAEWPCTDSHGVTGFDLPEGQALLSITPLCADDVPADPTSYIAPAAEQRLVIAGDTISLGAVEIIARVTGCSQPPTCICDINGLGHAPRR